MSEHVKQQKRLDSLDQTFDGYLASPKRLERLTYGLEGRCSIQLSYGDRAL